MNCTLWDIQQSLKSERNAITSTQASIKQWKELIGEMTASMCNVSTMENEWKVRYENQRLYNRMLVKEAQNMRKKLRLLQNEDEGGQVGEVTNPLEGKSLADCRRYIRNLHLEKCSLKSQRDMYERQLDRESMEYYRVRDALLLLVKDVRNHHDSWIRQQEQTDSCSLPEYKRSPGKLRDPAKVAVAMVRPLNKLTNKVSPRRQSNQGYKEIHKYHMTMREMTRTRQSIESKNCGRFLQGDSRRQSHLSEEDRPVTLNIDAPYDD